MSSQLSRSVSAPRPSPPRQPRQLAGQPLCPSSCQPKERGGGCLARLPFSFRLSRTRAAPHPPTSPPARVSAPVQTGHFRPLSSLLTSDHPALTVQFVLSTSTHPNKSFETSQPKPSSSDQSDDRTILVRPVSPNHPRKTSQTEPSSSDQSDRTILVKPVSPNHPR